MAVEAGRRGGGKVVTGADGWIGVRSQGAIIARTRNNVLTRRPRAEGLPATSSSL